MSQDGYVRMQKLYRKKYLKYEKDLEERLERTVNKFCNRIKEEAAVRVKKDKTLDARLAKELKDEVDRLTDWYIKEESSLLKKGLRNSAEIGMQGQDAAAMTHMKELIDKYDREPKVQGLFRKALGDPNPMLLRATYGEGLPDHIADEVWEKRWQDGMNLTDRIWRQQIDIKRNLRGMIEKSVNEGRSAVEFSRSVEDYLLKPGPIWRTDILPAKTDRASVAYNALRLARTETNRAYQQSQKMSAKNSELVKGVKWNLSMSHPTEWPPSAAYQGYPEICEYRAEHDHADMGPGIYKPDDAPWDHPNGLCYLTDELLKDQELIDLLNDKYDVDISASMVTGRVAYEGVYPGESDSFYKGIEDAHQKVRLHGEKTGNEMLVLVDRKSGTEMYALAGKKSSVSFDAGLIELLKSAPKDSYALVHNHPGSNSFSLDDIAVLISFSSLKYISIEGQNRLKYTLSLGKGAVVDKVKAGRKLDSNMDKVHNYFAKNVQAGKLESSFASRVHTHTAMDKTADWFQWDYRYNFDEVDKRYVKRFMKIMEEAVEY